MVWGAGLSGAECAGLWFRESVLFQVQWKQGRGVTKPDLSSVSRTRVAAELEKKEGTVAVFRKSQQGLLRQSRWTP